MTVRKSLAQQEEYRVRDRDGTREMTTDWTDALRRVRERFTGTVVLSFSVVDPPGDERTPVQCMVTDLGEPGGTVQGYGGDTTAALVAALRGGFR